MAHVLPAEAVADLEAYMAGGGGRALERARHLRAEGVIAEIRASGLRGRGGAGFPTGFKWDGLAKDGSERKFVVCNAAEGEPGTFKDRAILRRNPYQVVEGLAVAAMATGASQMFVGVKEKFALEIGRLERAGEEMSAAGILGDVPLTIVPGPDDYLLGEEKGLLEAIEGRDPLPRLDPPYVRGLFEVANGPKQPAVVNNVETLANVPPIVMNGADWFRSMGTQESPGTIVCTVGGDVAVDAVAEVELGTPLRRLIEDVAGGLISGGDPKIVLNGVSNSPLTGREVDTPISFEAMVAIGSGLGSAGFTVYEEGVCAVGVAAAASAFLYRGSCGQCPSCKLGTAAITERFATLALGGGGPVMVEEIAAWAARVTDANRCGLGAGQQALTRGLLQRFPSDVAHHAAGGECRSERQVAVTTIADWDEARGAFAYSDPILDDRPGA